MGLNKLIIFAFSLVTLKVVNAQNLIPNGDFEEHGIIGSLKSLGSLREWESPNSSTPDYLSNERKEITPFGQHFCGILIQIYTYSDDVEYLSVKLQNVLRRDQKYCISLYALRDSKTYFALRNISYAFSKERIYSKGTGFISMKNYDSFGYTDTLIKEKNSWMYMCSPYIANGDEKYLTIGCFSKKSSLLYKVEKGRPPSYVTYYYIDNVSLVEINDSSECNCTYKRENAISSNNNPKSFTDIDSLAVGVSIKIENIYFELNESALLPASFETLDKLYFSLMKNESIQIEISGHTDSKGNEQQNQILSENRAKAITDYLIKKGIFPNRIMYRGYGSTQPISDNNTDVGRSNNRRVEFKILKK